MGPHRAHTFGSHKEHQALGRATIKEPGGRIVDIAGDGIGRLICKVSVASISFAGRHNTTTRSDEIFA
jgi:hypothetical protein